jgi:hypothetical protein
MDVLAGSVTAEYEQAALSLPDSRSCGWRVFHAAVLLCLVGFCDCFSVASCFSAVSVALA